VTFLERERERPNNVTIVLQDHSWLSKDAFYTDSLFTQWMFHIW